jgi:IS4 transposase
MLTNTDQAETLITRPISQSPRHRGGTDGRIDVLATSLTDSAAFPAAEFGSLYHARGNIEEAFKLLKHWLCVEQFSDELPESIRQGFHVKVFTADLAEAVAREG